MSIALKWGAIQLPTIVAWANRIIEQQEKPDVDIIEVALSNDTNQALTHLNSLSSQVNESQTQDLVKRVYHYFYQSLVEKRMLYSTVAKAMFYLATDDLLPANENANQAFSFWDSLDLAESGHHGNPDEVKEEILEFLNQNS